MKNNRTIYLIIVFFFIQGIFHNVGHPVTPAFVRNLEIADYMFGIFFATMSFGMMLGGPIWGIASDYGHRKLYIVIGLLLYSVGQLGFGYSGTALGMVIFRFISGFGVASSFTLMTSQIIEESDPRQRTRNLAYAAAAVTLGASLGYGLGGFLSTNAFITEILGTNDYRRIFLIQAILNSLYALSIAIWLKDSKKTAIKATKASILGDFKNISKVDPKLLIFLLSLMFINIGSVNLSKYIDVYFDELGYNPEQLGIFVMATGIVSLVATLLLVPIVAKFSKQLHTIAFIQVASAAIVFYVFRAQAFLLVIYTVYMIYIVLRTLYQPLEQNYISQHAKTGKLGSIMGIRQSFVSIGMVVGPVLGGFLYEWNPLRLFDFSAVAFLIAALLLGLIYLMDQKSKKNDTKSLTPNA